ncbi:MAG: hypothetical protein ACOYD4_04070 [Solirubrobacterales bacterium]
MNVDEINRRIQAAKYSAMERAFVDYLRATEPVMPGEPDISLFGQRYISPVSETLTWKGILVVRVDYWPSPLVPFKIWSISSGEKSFDA